MKKTKLFSLFLFCISLFLISCKEDTFESDVIEEVNTQGVGLRSQPTIPFNWENLDWMPTPLGQSGIPSPWNGAGSIASLYGIDIVNDRKSEDGWELLYSSFGLNSSGPLINPYFILYNKYSGLMRIFLYTTTPFVSTSSYLQDGLSVVSNHKTHILAYLGQDVIDFDNSQKTYLQMQPAPSDGSFPLASNKWYMLQYELAYDPSLSQLPYNEIMFNWFLNYHNVETFSFGGKQEGKLNAIMGSSAESNNIISSASKLGEKVGTGVIAGIGQGILDRNTLNSETDKDKRNNSLGLSNSIFSSLSKGVSTAISGASGDIPGVAMSLLSAIFKFNKLSQSAVPINYSLSTTIQLEGKGTSGGSFPSSPLSFWMPGTNISSEAAGYIPLYNKVLGVFYFESPIVNTSYSELKDRNKYIIGYEFRLSTQINYSSYLKFNPEVLKTADVSVKDQKVIFSWGGSGAAWQTFDAGERFKSYNKPSVINLAVRFVIEVKPKNGASSIFLIKTFKLKESRTTNSAYYGPIFIASDNSPNGSDIGTCTICGYVYNNVDGCGDCGPHIIPEGTSFRDIASNIFFECPWCKADITYFETM